MITVSPRLESSGPQVDEVVGAILSGDEAKDVASHIKIDNDMTKTKSTENGVESYMDTKRTVSSTLGPNLNVGEPSQAREAL